MRDVVRYRIPFGPLGRLAHRLFVRRMLDRIFDYRAEATSKLLSDAAPREYFTDRPELSLMQS